MCVLVHVRAFACGVRAFACLRAYVCVRARVRACVCTSARAFACARACARVTVRARAHVVRARARAMRRAEFLRSRLGMGRSGPQPGGGRDVGRTRRGSEPAGIMPVGPGPTRVKSPRHRTQAQAGIATFPRWFKFAVTRPGAATRRKPWPSMSPGLGPAVAESPRVRVGPGPAGAIAVPSLPTVGGPGSRAVRTETATDSALVHTAMTRMRWDSTRTAIIHRRPARGPAGPGPGHSPAESEAGTGSHHPSPSPGPRVHSEPGV